MMMITDANQSEKPFADLAKGLEELGNEMGLTSAASTKIFLIRCIVFKP